MGLTATVSKWRKFPGLFLKKTVLTVLAGQTPNGKMFIVAYCISYAECAEDMSFLLNFCMQVGLPINCSRFVILSDRGGAIGKAVSDTLPLSIHFFCPVHLLRSLQAKFTMTDVLKSLFWAARETVTRTMYDIEMSKIRAVSDEGAKMCEYLSGVPNWPMYQLVARGGMLYGMRSNNLSEGLFAKLLPARQHSIYYMHKTIQILIFGMDSEQRDEVDALAKSGKMLTRKAQDLFDTEKRSLLHESIYRPFAIQTTCSRRNKATVRYVGDSLQMGTTFNVDLMARTCTCEFHAQTGVPCRHMQAVASRNKVELTIDHYGSGALATHLVRMYDSPTMVGQYPTDGQIADAVT